MIALEISLNFNYFYLFAHDVFFFFSGFLWFYERDVVHDEQREGRGSIYLFIFIKIKRVLILKGIMVIFWGLNNRATALKTYRGCLRRWSVEMGWRRWWGLTSTRIRRWRRRHVSANRRVTRQSAATLAVSAMYRITRILILNSKFQIHPPFNYVLILVLRSHCLREIF